MKACPTCNRTFEDTFTFCLIDGSVLSAPYDPAEGKQLPQGRSNPPPTEIISAPTKAAEIPQPLQSTIRAPVPQVPDLHPPEIVGRSAEKEEPVSLIFRIPLAARGILAAVFIIPWMFVQRGGWAWNALYPLLAGILAIPAGLNLYAKYKLGRFLVLEGIVAVIAGLVVLLSDRAWWHTQATWPLVSGVLLIAAAIELRKYFARTWLLGLAGGIFTAYTILKTAIFYGDQQKFSMNLIIAMIYAEGAVAFTYGVILALFSFATRRRNLSGPN